MAHFALVCPEDAGHLLSNGPVGVELIRRGHQVTLIAREPARALAEQLGLGYHLLDTDDIRSTNFPITWLAFEAVRAGHISGMRSYFAWKAKAMLQLLPPIFKELKIDGVICDQILPSVGTAAERVGIPFVTICSALLWNEEGDLPPPYTGWLHVEGAQARLRNRLGYAGWHWFVAPILAIINRFRRSWDLPTYERIDETFSPLAQISQLCEGFDFPRKQTAPHFHYIGSLAANRQSNNDYDFPWDRLDGRPLIFASLGTVPDSSNVPVFHRIAEACIGVDAQLVLALGKWNKQGEDSQKTLGTLPGDHVVVAFAPQLKLLDRAALLITHAGVNTVLESLTRGVPMVALPRSADQPGMGSRILYSGTGLRGSFQHSTSAEIRDLVRRVLAEDVFRQRAAALKETMIAAGGLTRAADIAEQALTTRQPVTK